MMSELFVKRLPKNSVWVFRHCRNCKFKCHNDRETVGCLSVYGVAGCFYRVWFNRKYEVTDFWRVPTKAELENNLRDYHANLKRELEMLKHGK